MQLNTSELYRRYGPMVLRRCRRLLGDEEQARDAMQDVFVRLLRSREWAEGTREGALLQTISTNVCLNRLRSRRRAPELPGRHELLGGARRAPDPSEPEAERAPNAVELASAIAQSPEAFALQRSFLAKLFGREPPSTALIAVLHYVDGLTLEEVAREVGLSVSGVRKRLRGLKMRVSKLEEQQP